MSDNIHVAVRVRPLIAREKNSKSEIHWKVENKNTINQIDNTGKVVPYNSFTFDRVFDANESNVCIYEEICLPIVNSVMEGFNGTIFAYGQTSSGKTYTMVGTLENPGIIFFTINSVFDTIENMPDREFLLRVSYMEIYNESISDLLSENTNQNLRVFENMDGQLLVQELKEETVTNYDQIIKLWRQGEKNRHTDATCMNDKSSRSHTIFRMIIESRKRGDNLDDAVNVAHLNLVDLAGSERSGQTGATGERFKEGVHINKSLLMLGHVISRLSEGEGQFVNYRDSKLTRILQNSLGGNARTAIICTVTPASQQQTQSTLLFASRAKCIKNKPVVNEVLTDAAMLKRCKKQIKQLNDELEKVKNSSHSEKVSAMEKELEEKTKRLSELEQTIKSLTENVVVSKQVPGNQPLRKARRETWCAPLHYAQSPLSFHSELSTLRDEQQSVSKQLTPPYIDDHFLNFTELPPVIFEANLQAAEKQKLVTDVIEPDKRKRTVMFKLPQIDKEIQTDSTFEEGKSFEKVLEDYKIIENDYERIRNEYLQIQEFTTLEKQILNEENIGKNDLIQMLYQRIKSQEAHIGEVQDLFTKHYFSPQKNTNLSFIKEKLVDDKFEEKQKLIEELNQLKNRLKISEETINNLQNDKERLSELELLKQKNVKEKEEIFEEKQRLTNELNQLRNKLKINEETVNSLKNDKVRLNELEQRIEQKNIRENEISEEKQKLTNELNQLKNKLKTYEETIDSLQNNKERLFELEHLIKQKNIREKELSMQLDETYKELNHSKNTLQLKTENFYEQLKEKNREIDILQNELSLLSNNTDKSNELKENNEKYKKQINILLQSIQNCDIEKKEIKLEISTFYEPLKNLSNEIIAILSKNLELENVISDLKQKYQELEKYSNSLRTEFSMQQKSSDKIYKIPDSEFGYQSIIEQWLMELVIIKETELDQYYWYHIQNITECIKNTFKNDISKNNFEKNRELLSSIQNNICLYKTEIENLKGKILLLKNREEEYKLIINDYRNKYNEILRLDSDINAKYEKNFQNIFDLHVEIEQEKYKQETNKYNLLQEIYEMNDAYNKLKEYVTKQLTQIEQMLSDEEFRCSELNSLKEKVSSLLDNVKYKDDEIERHKLLLCEKEEEIKSLNVKFEAVKKDLEDIKSLSLPEKKSLDIQCSILDMKTFSDISTKLEDCNCEKKEIEAELIHVETENKNLLSTIEIQEKTLSDYKLKINSLEAELDKINEFAERYKNKLKLQNTFTQTELPPVLNAEDAILEARKELCKQKMLNLEMKNQLCIIQKDSEAKKEENKYLTEKIQQLKMEIRRLQQPADLSISYTPKMKEPNENKLFYESGGSGIINNFKVDWMENRIHALEKELKKCKKENSRLKSQTKENTMEEYIKDGKDESISKPDQIKILQESFLQKNTSGNKLPANKLIHSVPKKISEDSHPTIDLDQGESKEDCKVQ